MVFRNLIEALSHCVFKRDVDALNAESCRLWENKKLSNKEFQVFGDIALRYRSFLLD